MYRLIFIFFLLETNASFAQSANSLFGKANEEFLTGNYAGAINYCNKALAKNRSLKEANLIAGLACYNLKDTIKAITYFDNELINTKGDYRPYLYKAKLTNKNYAAALNNLQTAIKIQPGNFLLYFEKGNLNFDHLNYKPAIEDYTKAIALRAGLDDANYKLTLCHLYLADTVKACYYWNKISEQDDFKNYETIQSTCHKPYLK